MIFDTGAVKHCPKCGNPMGANRGICAECGHMGTWFQIRLLLGCAGLVFGFAAMLGMLLMAMFAG